MPTSNRHFARRHAGGRLKPLAAAMALAAAFCALPGPAAAQAPAAASYSIPPGPLAEALNRFAQQSGAALVIDTARVRGLQSPGLQGRYGVEDGFAALLRGTGLVLGKTDAGYVLVAAPQGAQAPAAAGGGSATATLREVTVIAEAERTSVTEGTGSYVPSTVSIGKGQQALKDVPQSVTVISRQRMDDQGLRSIDDVMGQAAGVSVTANGLYGSNYTARGLAVNKTRYDGGAARSQMIYTRNGYDDMAPFDHVEVLRGADGLFSGAGEAGGVGRL